MLSTMYFIHTFSPYVPINTLSQPSTPHTSSTHQVICGTYEIGRALESVAIMRAVTDQYNRQTPSNQLFTPSLLLLNYLSTQTNGKYWSAMYNDLCVNKGSAMANTDYLTAMGGPGMGRKSITFGGASWVQLKARMPILILSAGNK